MLYSLYPFFVAVWLILDKQFLSPLSFFRIALATLAVLLLTAFPSHKTDLVGAIMMLGAAALYALHLPINQRVLYEVPAPTVTLYTLLAMSAVVVPAFLLFDTRWPSLNLPWWPVLGLTLVTSLSRLTLFLGIKHIGGMQTALLGLAELLVAILFSYVWLHESLQFTQWLGAISLSISLLLVRFEKPALYHAGGKAGWLSWIRSPDVPQEIPWGPHE
jgi:drug/metabolite transporter (DMT)-like permease